MNRISMGLHGEAFSPEDAGHPEAQWESWSSRLPRWQPPSAPLVIVAPHPDDETLGAGGLIAQWAEKCLPVTVISVTDGEGAIPDYPDLRTTRHRELYDALHALGIADPTVIRLSLPDGRVSEHETEVAAAIVSQTQPGSIVVAPFEHDGHADHEAAGRASLSAVERCGARLLRYPIWAWHRGSAQLQAGPAVRIEIPPALVTAKQHAIQQFRSQVERHSGRAILPTHVLRYFQHDFEVYLS